MTSFTTTFSFFKNLSRCFNYLFQYAFLEIYSEIKGQPIRNKKLGWKLRKVLNAETLKLLKEDARNIKEGYYPSSVILFESPFKHYKRTWRIFKDFKDVTTRRKKRLYNDLQSELKKEYPDYYLRNFHYQTDGYLSKQSAEFYDHQVEILFSGTADLMRRVFIKPLKDLFPEAKDFSLLEVAAGTGNGAFFTKQAFPDSQITITDISPYYIDYAQQKLKKLNSLAYYYEDATQLSFSNQSFDRVLSIFLFHELPFKERVKVLQEKLRVLKKGGVYCIVDSLQLGDNPSFDPVLQAFPHYYHEPFYADYIKKPLEDLISQNKLGQVIHKSHHLLAKCLLVQKI